MTIPSVNITVSDNASNASIQLPLQQVQAKIGVLLSVALVAANVPFATSNAGTVQSNLVAGALCEAAGMVCEAGGTVICVGIPLVSKGTATAVVATVPGGSSSVVTVTVDSTNGAYDDYYVMLRCVTGGTIASNGIQLQVSLDAGRIFGPVLNLGTARSLAITNTGLTRNFGAGTMVAKDYWRFSTTGPAGNAAGVQAAINALAASQYGVAGWGSLHIVGVAANTNVTNYQSYVDTIRTANFVFSRFITEARDALAPTAWGGSGESEVTWINSLATAFGSTSAIRGNVSAGHYNMPSAFPNALAGTPSYRRALAWANAVRRVQVAPQRHGGAVADGALSSIVVDPTNDPGDGFIYHNEKGSPGLDAARFTSALVWPKKQSGFYICDERLMSPNGSQYTKFVLGNVIDLACDIAYAEGVEVVNADLRTQDNGTLYPHDGVGLQNTIDKQLKADMTDNGYVSNAYSAVDLTNDVALTDEVKITVTVIPKAYAQKLTETLNLGVP